MQKYYLARQMSVCVTVCEERGEGKGRRGFCGTHGCFSLSVVQCGAGLQAAGGQAAAADEEAVPRGGRPLLLSALPPGGLHLHPQTQVQSRLQEARALETLVPVKWHQQQPTQHVTGFMHLSIPVIHSLLYFGGGGTITESSLPV